MGYLWLKAVHVLAIISWMVGMLYMPRLFVYHVEAGQGSPQAATFQVMERRLQKAIMLPAMIVSWLTGLWLAISGGWLNQTFAFFAKGQNFVFAYSGGPSVAGWLHAKLLLVVLLTGVHGYLAAERKRLAAGTSTRDSKFFRIINEVPTLLLIGIVILVVVKPF